MSQPDPSARPSQVTAAAWAVTAASVLLLVVVFDTMGSLHTIEMRDRLSKAVSSGTGQDLGLSVGGLTEMLRWLMFVTGVAATVAAILGPFVLKRMRDARIGLTVAVAPIVLTAPVTGTFLGVFLFLGCFLGFATASLWTRDAADWFAGRPIRPRPGPVRPEPPAPPSVQQRTPWSPPSAGSRQPPPTPGWGQAPGAPPVPPPSPDQPQGHPVAPPQGPPGGLTGAPPAAAWPPPRPPLPPLPYGGPHPYTAPVPPAHQRPQQVLVACLLTWIFSGLTALLSLLVLSVVAADSQSLVDELEKTSAWDSSFDDHTFLTVLVVVAIVLIVWCAGASVLAFFAWRRAPWARSWLVATMSLAAFLCVLAFPASLLHLVAIGVSIGLLVRAPTRNWFDGSPPDAPRRSGPRGGWMWMP